MAQKNVTVGAVMTAPRYESVLARSQIELALHTLGIPLRVSQGVYYGQCMQSMLQELVAQGVGYALTVDFDSMFAAAHVQRLLDIVASYGYVHALAALQPMRGKGRILGSTGTQVDIEWDGKPVKVVTAHFGLTVIDLARLAQVPKPWFASTPDSNGEWGDGKTDDDVHFWRQWQAAGNDAYLDPGCRLGHLEEMVSVHDEHGQLTHLYPSQWSERSASTVD